MIQRTAFALALLLGPSVIAQTYIAADGDCGTVTLHVTRGNDFPRLGESIPASLVKEARVYLPKQRILVKPDEDRDSLTFSADVPYAETVVMAAVDFNPVVSGDETRTEHAKTFLFCGTPAPRVDWQHSAELGLEIYPQGWNGPRPRMKPGDTMKFIAVDRAENKMLHDLPMALYGDGMRRIAEGVTGHDGFMNFPFQKPGRYLVVATYRRPDPEKQGHWLVDTSTLTFDIK